MVSQYFIGGMMPESANPVQQPETIIEIRLSSAFRFCLRGISGSKVFVPKKKVYLTDTVRFNRQDPINFRYFRGGLREASGF